MVNFVVNSKENNKIAPRLWKDTNPEKFRDNIKWDNILVWDKIKLPPRPENLS
jgi:hypothetical protein